VARQWRVYGANVPPRGSGALGIPTMFSGASTIGDDAKFAQLMGHVDTAMDQIDDWLSNHPNVRLILWTASTELILGIAIATGATSPEQLEQLQQKVKERMQAIIGKFNLKTEVYGQQPAPISNEEFQRLLCRG
jgi:hypothetical protein